MTPGAFSDPVAAASTAATEAGGPRGATIEVQALRRLYGQVAALREATLSVAAGEFVSLLGASGSGKSTLLRLIAGLERASAGRILLAGADATALPPERRGIGMVFQDYALFPTMTVEENIGFPLRMRGIGGEARRRRIAAVAEMLGLGHLLGRRSAQLSGGQQQRVAIARAIVFEPRILLLDEPLSALDKNLREQTKGEIKALHARLGVTVLYVTHDQSEALAMSDRIAVMDEGRIVDVDTPRALYARPRSRFIAEFLGQANLLPVTLRERRAETCLFESPWGVLAVPAANVALGAGARGLAVVRPEHLLLVEAPPAGSRPQVRAAVSQALYNGAETIYHATCRASGLALTLLDKRAGHAPRTEGELCAEIAAEHLVVVPEDRGAA